MGPSACKIIKSKIDRYTLSSDLKAHLILNCVIIMMGFLEDNFLLNLQIY